MKVAITGESGFLGYHIFQYLKYVKKYEVVSLGRDYQNNISKVKGCDWLIHCSGVNRGLDVGDTNVSITKELIFLLKQNKIAINIAFSSSTQVDLENDYGNSKMKCEKLLKEYCDSESKNFIAYKIPNLFGPFGKPNYNSFVSTFCYNEVNKIQSRTSDSYVNLCYVYDAVQIICEFSNQNFTTNKVSVNQVYDLVRQYHENYTLGIFPKINTQFELNLFNTYRSFSNPYHNTKKIYDNRGYLMECVKSKGSESQIFFSVTKPGITRGNHFHFSKIERFCILKGEAEVKMRRIGTDDIKSYIINEDTNAVIDMPVLHTHNIKNIGNEELICVFWTNEIFDPQNPDTYFIDVENLSL